MTTARFTTAAHKSDRHGETMVPVTELLTVTYKQTRDAAGNTGIGAPVYGGRAYAAVMLAMRSDAYSDEDRADTAAELVARTLAKAPVQRTAAAPTIGPDRVTVGGRRTGTAAEVLAHIAAAERHAAAPDATAVPAHLCSVTRLYHEACNLRRSLDATKRRADEAAEERAAEHRAASLEDHTLEASRAEVLRGTAHGAHRTALAMLDAIGCRPVRKADAALYSTAYAAARAAYGVEREEIAAELHTNANTLKQHVHRTAKRHAYGTVAMWADALLIGNAATGSDATPLPDTFGVRTAPGHVFPNAAPDRRVIAAAPVSERVTAPSRKRWDLLPVTRRRTAGWATGITSARTHSRLSAAARVQRERAAAKSAEQRAEDRAAAGLPGTVR